MSETTSDPSITPPRLPSWVKNLPAVTSEVPVPVPPWHAQVVQVVKPHLIQHRLILSVGGGLMLALGLMLAIGSSKKPAPEKTAAAPAVAAPAEAPVAPAAPTALAAAKPAEPEHRPAVAKNRSATKSKTAAPRAVRAKAAAPTPAKAAPKDRRPARPATGRG